MNFSLRKIAAVFETPENYGSEDGKRSGDALNSETKFTYSREKQPVPSARHRMEERRVVHNQLLF